MPNGIQIHTKVFELVEVSEEDAKKTMEEEAALQKTNGHSVLQAVREDNPTQALALLSSGQPCDPNVNDKNGITSLLYATEKGMTEVCLKLLESGADVNMKGSNEKAPLWIAMEKANMKLFEMLLQHKADANTKDGRGNTPLLYATEKGMTEVCMKLLESGANPNVNDGRGSTHLLYTTEKGMTEACLALIKPFFEILDNMR